MSEHLWYYTLSRKEYKQNSTNLHSVRFDVIKYNFARHQLARE